MSKFGIVVTFLILVLSLHVQAQSQNNFAGIPFGSTRETVIEEMMKKGYEPYGQTGIGERVVIPVYMFGELPVQVDFIFNKNDKFYAFEIRTGRVERARLSKTFEAVAYMSDQFTLKYGKPSGSPAISEVSTLKENVHNLYQEWFSVKILDAYTAVIQKGNRYYAVGSVTHRQLATEAETKRREKPAEAPVF
ncbi:MULTISPECIES: hypothetical protein [unclassified Fibrobacter]|uniref:hypothetical protein n=1 Tax=unclassified Fibrobacter TaxID=2634177 RepID=UPI00091248B9|nr:MULTISPECIES: hypothetical protein [unclassified Fibrobacter]SHL01964.1 hypothetical protein SAMN05720759_11333 [Fibrobacter sp. UWB12]SIO42049.1 hypothetical protein SAMN05720758_2845 [Fibrobacter sp. UWB11]